MALLRDSEASRFGSTADRDASAVASARFERAAAVARDLRAAKRAARSAGGGVEVGGTSEVLGSSFRGGGEEVDMVVNVFMYVESLGLSSSSIRKPDLLVL